MDGASSLGQRLLGHCRQLPGAELTYPFGPQPAAYKIGGKLFAAFRGPAVDAVPTQLTLKCEPDHAAALRREYAAIQPGYHLNKRHWITLELTGDLPAQLAEELLEDSYDLVLNSLPRATRARLSAERARPGGD